MRPEDDLVAAFAGLRVTDHGLIHAVEVDSGRTPDDGLDGSALNGTLGEVGGGEVLPGRRTFRSFEWLAHDSSPFFKRRRRNYMMTPLLKL
jgi:hypothetical protein